MNEKIRELATEAGAQTKSRCYGHGEYLDEFQLINDDIEKFAELIVQECMDIIVEQTTLDENEDFREGFSLGRKLVWMEIRHRFGVK